MLVGLIDDPSSEPKHVVLPTRLVERGSLHASARHPHDDVVEQTEPLYRDPTVPVDERVADLLARMTLDEKVAQLGSRWVFELADGDGLVEQRGAGYLAHGLGQVTRISGASSLRPRRGGRRSRTRSSATSSSSTRLGIPAIVHEEICSGLMARGATVFPQAIGAREHVGARRSSRQLADDDPRADARDRRAPGPRPGARRLPRPALGPHSRRRSARIRTSSRAWASRSSAASRATTSQPASSRPASTSSATARPRAAATGRRRIRRRACSATSTSIRSRPRSATPASAR